MHIIKSYKKGPQTSKEVTQWDQVYQVYQPGREKCFVCSEELAFLEHAESEKDMRVYVLRCMHRYHGYCLTQLFDIKTKNYIVFGLFKFN
jgi:hypothetical protein